MISRGGEPFSSLPSSIFVVWAKIDVVILEMALNMSSNGL
jgi:hypothetical protein